ncbi:hypothetical protein [Sulfurimonas hydrogeniphila]|uniref:hypothetical protein n=1 Tax=Sulfurimonas hydrogeniphila TaxID=2509341 RepID=UPI00125EC528|nr:hypothetical protein [Sulfurimonas hydrogeniphila]
MNIYEQIDTIFSGESEEIPKWAEQILIELKEIKSMLKEQKTVYKQQIHKSSNKEFYDFIDRFRKKMKADVVNKIYPTFEYNGKNIGIDFKGLLYDKKDLKLLSRSEAYMVYKYAYNMEKNNKHSA